MTSTFQDFGANGDGTGNDASAIESALESGDMIRNPADSVYRVSQQVNVLTSKNIDWEGGTVKYAGGTGGGAVSIKLDTNGSGKQVNLNQSVNINNCSILAETQSNAFGLRLAPEIEPVTTDDLIRQKAPLRIGDGVVVGPWVPDSATTSGHFKTGIELVSPQNLSVGAVQVKQRKVGLNGSFVSGSVGILITGSGQPVLMDFFGVQIREFETGVRITAGSHGIEGVSFRGGSIVHVKYGINADFGSSAGNDPGFWCTGMHINASAISVKIKDAYDAIITQNELYHDQTVDQSAAWTGIEVSNTTKFQVAQNVIYGSASENAGEGRAIKLTGGTKEGTVFDNIGYDLNKGIWIASLLSVPSTGDIYVRDNVFRNESKTLLSQTTSTPTNVNVAWSF